MRFPKFVALVFLSNANFPFVNAYSNSGRRANIHDLLSFEKSLENLEKPRPELGNRLHFARKSPHDLVYDVFDRDVSNSGRLYRRSEPGESLVRRALTPGAVQQKMADRRKEARAVHERYRKQVQAMHKIDPRKSPEQAREMESMAATAPQLKIADAGRIFKFQEVRELRAERRFREAADLEWMNTQLFQAQDRWNNLLRIMINTQDEFKRTGNWRWEYRQPKSAQG